VEPGSPLEVFSDAHPEIGKPSPAALTCCRLTWTCCKGSYVHREEDGGEISPLEGARVHWMIGNKMEALGEHMPMAAVLPNRRLPRVLHTDAGGPLHHFC
jgi:hypothetical protein